MAIKRKAASVSAEALQDIIGGMLVDSTSIDFIYNDIANTITAGFVNGDVNLADTKSVIWNGTAVDSAFLQFTTNAPFFFGMRNAAGNYSWRWRREDAGTNLMHIQSNAGVGFMSFDGGILPNTANTKDIGNFGTAGANISKWRSGYFGTSLYSPIVAGTEVAAGNLTLRGNTVDTTGVVTTINYNNVDTSDISGATPQGFFINKGDADNSLALTCDNANIPGATFGRINLIGDETFGTALYVRFNGTDHTRFNQSATDSNRYLHSTGFFSTTQYMRANGNADPGATADSVKIGGIDLASTDGRRSLAIRTEEAVAVNVAVASTHSLTVMINGVEYKIPLVAV